MHKILRGHISPPLLEAAISKYGKAPKAEEVAPNVDKVVPANEDDFKFSLRSLKGDPHIALWAYITRLYSLYQGRGRCTTRSDEPTFEGGKCEAGTRRMLQLCSMRGLVYDKNECRIIGFIDLGPVNNAFASFERTLDESGSRTAPIAKQILVFMVRGIFMKLKFPYAQFPTSAWGLRKQPLFPSLGSSQKSRGSWIQGGFAYW